MSEQILKFILLDEPNVFVATLGLMLLGLSTSIVGCLAFLQKKALIGDVVAHAALPGVCLGFMISGEKDVIWLLGGAFLMSWLSVFLMQSISKYSKIKDDTALAIVMGVFFGFGVWLLSMIKHSNNASQAGIESYILGSAASISQSDLKVLLFVAVLVILVLVFFFKEIKLFCFDSQYAFLMGKKISFWEWLINALIILSVAIGVQAVGVVLMSSMLIAPAATAFYMTKKLSTMLVIASFFGLLNCYLGAAFSYLFPALPTGPIMVFFAFFFAIIAFLVKSLR